MAMRPVMVWGSQCWTTRKHALRMNTTTMRTLRQMRSFMLKN